MINKKLIVGLMLATGLLLGACAPLPGSPISTQGISKMSIEEVLQYADEHRGPAPMFKTWEEMECEPMSAYDAYKQGRLKIYMGNQLEVTGECAKRICSTNPVQCAIMVLGVAPPLACAEAFVAGDCKQRTTIWAPNEKSKHMLLHEIRHAQGYDDLLY